MTSWRHYKASGEGDLIELASRLRGYERLRVQWGSERRTTNVTLFAHWSGHGYGIDRIEVDGANLDERVLAVLPLRAVLARAVLDTVQYGGEGALEVERAAAIFRVGLIIGEAPVQLVADELGVHLNTAKRRIAEARALGILKDDERAPRGGAALRASSRLGAEAIVTNGEA